MLEVLRPLLVALEAGRPVALCQVVATRGSTPQHAGAMLLLDPDGSQIGTLGGGCVEGEVKKKAAGLIGREGPELLPFTLDHDPAWADGLICGGRMTILAECPRGPAALAYYRAYRDRIDAGLGLTEAVALDPARTGMAAGDRFLFDHAGQLVAALAGAAAPPEAAAGLGALEGKPRPTEANGWAYLPAPPRVRLLIVGAGHVGRAVAELAARVDFDVTILDDRPEFVTPERFPTARRRIVGPIATVLADFAIPPGTPTYALIVTRGHGHDQEALGLLAPSAAAYVGLIGSRRKIRQITEALLDAGLPEAALARVAAPVGLDIGSETVDEIALSILAELIARRNRGPEALAQLRAAGGRRALP